MNLTKVQIKARFKAWCENHVGNYEGDAFWNAQNAVGDILGWPEFWAKFVKELQEEQP